MKGIISLFFSILIMMFLNSCSSALPPRALISTTFFEVTTPGNERWYIESENENIIELRKGSFGGELTRVDLPVLHITILRRSINFLKDDKFSTIDILKSEVFEKTKELITELTYGYGYDEDKFNVESNNYDTNFYYSIVYLNYCYDINCLAQTYIYLPKYYDVWRTYYLIFYNQHPGELYGHLDVYLTEILNGFKCVEDSIAHK